MPGRGSFLPGWQVAGAEVTSEQRGEGRGLWGRRCWAEAGAGVCERRAEGRARAGFWEDALAAPMRGGVRAPRLAEVPAAVLARVPAGPPGEPGGGSGGQVPSRARPPPCLDTTVPFLGCPSSCLNSFPCMTLPSLILRAPAPPPGPGRTPGTGLPNGSLVFLAPPPYTGLLGDRAGPYKALGRRAQQKEARDGAGGRRDRPTRLLSGLGLPVSDSTPVHKRVASFSIHPLHPSLPPRSLKKSGNAWLKAYLQQ